VGDETATFENRRTNSPRPTQCPNEKVAAAAAAVPAAVQVRVLPLPTAAPPPLPTPSNLAMVNPVSTSFEQIPF